MMICATSTVAGTCPARFTTLAEALGIALDFGWGRFFSVPTSGLSRLQGVIAGVCTVCLKVNPWQLVRNPTVPSLRDVADYFFSMEGEVLGGCHVEG